ncbi:MAG: BatD family protein [Myxococcota bacterium]
MATLAGLLFCGIAIAIPAMAADLRVQIAKGPYYIGDAFEIQVVATDFEEEPPPEISIGRYSGISVRLVSVSPSTSTSISIINGRMTRVHEVTFVYRYEAIGTRAGRARIPEFLVEQAGTSKSTQSFHVELSSVPTTELVRVELELPPGAIFVGQKVPIAIEFGIDRQMQSDLVSYQIHVPLFDSSALRFLDRSLPDPDTHLTIQTEAGLLRLPATSREELIRGRPMLIVRAERIMIAVAPLEIRAEAAKVFVNRGVRYRRDLFNQRRATLTEKFVATDRAVSIEVAEVPRKGRPPSFAGAVGEGFSLEVSADRSVVQLGEPISLSFHLRGDGDLSSAGLPPLDAPGLFDPKQFRIPEDSPAGILDEDGKSFDVIVRVLDAGVREIPALAYSWFDAKTRKFETARSQPIALSVGAAQVIGADAVTRLLARGSESAVPSVADRPVGANGKGVVRSTSLLWTGANLAVERDLSRLLRRAGTGGRNDVWILFSYASGVILLGFAAFDARRREADPQIRRRARVFKRAKHAVEKAFEQPEIEGAAALGRALRELLAELPDEAGMEMDQLISECDTLRFARASEEGRPSSDKGRLLPAPLRDRTRQLLRLRLMSAPKIDSGVSL